MSCVEGLSFICLNVTLKYTTNVTSTAQSPNKGIFILSQEKMQCFGAKEGTFGLEETTDTEGVLMQPEMLHSPVTE